MDVTASPNVALQPRRAARRIAVAAVVVLGFLSSAEFTARVEDLVLMGTPLWATPDRARDLVVHDELGIRGKPNGRFKKWHLNSYGFRNEPMSQLPRPGVIRVMVLGASETFGLYERDGDEYPAQLRARLEPFGSYEVVNAAVAGLSLPGICQLWESWGVRFKPAVVVVYPTPAFYLAGSPPHRPGPQTTVSDAPRWPNPRLLDALTDRFDFPAFVQRRRVARWLAAAEANRPPGWQFRTVPADRLARFAADLAVLLDSIRAAGAEPILMTHAVGFHNPPTSEEADQVAAWRQFTPRATTEILFQFEAATSKVSEKLANDGGVPIVDLAGRVSGNARWFAEDYLHFSEEGARVVASLIADAIISKKLTPRLSS